MHHSLDFKTSQLLFHARIDVTSHVVKKNNRPVFHGMICKSKKLRSAEFELANKLTIWKSKNGITSPIITPVWVIFHFYFSNYFTIKGERSKKLPDLSNLYQLPEDMLQTTGILSDDNLIRAHDESRIMPGSINELEIFILKYTERF